MNISKYEIKLISDNYDLGIPLKYCQTKEGWVNSNLILKTIQGEFIIRILGEENLDQNLIRLKLKFEVLDYLKLSNFPYEVPHPIKGINGEEIFKINNRYLWVYRMIKGKTQKRQSARQIKQLAKAVSLYHKYMQDFSLSKKEFGLNHKIKQLNIKIKQARKDKEFILLLFQRLKDVIGIGEDRSGSVILIEKRLNKMLFEDKIDIEGIVINNISLIEAAIDRIKNFKFMKNRLVIHNDLHYTNILYSKNNLIGFIDFQNLKLAPRICDISNIVRDWFMEGKRFNERGFYLFLREYEKILKLSPEEKKYIFYFIILDSCEGLLYHMRHADPKEGKLGQKRRILKMINSMNLALKFIESSELSH